MMKFQITQAGSLVFFLLMFMVVSQLHASPLPSSRESALKGEATASGAIETEAELPSLVFTENSGHSFLSRVFTSVLQSEEQTDPHISTAIPSPHVSSGRAGSATFEDEASASPSGQRASHSALRFMLFFSVLVISWGLIAWLAFRLVLMKNTHGDQLITAETITSTGYQVLGDIAVENRKFQLAEQCYRKIAEKESYNKEIHYDIGKALFQAERYQDAIREFQIALGCEIVSTDMYGFLAKAYQAVNQPERAAQYAQKAMQSRTPAPVASRKKETRNVIPLQKRLKSPKVPRQAHKLSA